MNQSTAVPSSTEDPNAFVSGAPGTTPLYEAATAENVNEEREAQPSSSQDPSPSSESGAPSAVPPAFSSGGRCTYVFPKGRHCRAPAYGHFSTCRKHGQALGYIDDHGHPSDILVGLMEHSEDLYNHDGVLRLLASLARLVAKDLVSTRRAAVLAYISAQILRCLSEIEKRDDKNGPPIIFGIQHPLHVGSRGAHCETSPAACMKA